MSITAVQCRFKHHRDDAWEYGLAITTARGLSDVVVIIPSYATTPADVIQELWEYKLLWTDGILELESHT